MFGKRPIVGPYRTIHMRTQALVHRVYISQGRGIEEDVIPGEFYFAFARKVIECKIRREPGRIDEASSFWRGFADVASDERWGGKDHRIGPVVPLWRLYEPRAVTA